MRPKTTLDQWATLSAVDKAGSFQAAAIVLSKSHTTLIYAIKKLEQQLGVALVQVEGRRAVLTDDGKSLLRRAVPMLDQAQELELIGGELSKGMEAEITVTIDHLCSRAWLFGPLSRFIAEHRGTSVQVLETSLSGTQAAVTESVSDIAIITLPVANHLSEAFGITTMIPVVSRNHSLAQKTTLCMEDLTAETQIVVRDLGQRNLNVHGSQQQNVGWLKSQQRITVDNFDHAWECVNQGLGFCRIPDHMLEKLDTRQVVQLPLQGGLRYQVPVHLTLPKAGRTGPAAMALYTLLLEGANQRLGECEWEEANDKEGK